MNGSPDKNVPLKPEDFPEFPPTDETGDVDLSLLDYNLSLTVAERIERNGDALKLVRALENVRRQWYGSDAGSPEEADGLRS